MKTENYELPIERRAELAAADRWAEALRALRYLQDRLARMIAEDAAQ